MKTNIFYKDSVALKAIVSANKSGDFEEFIKWEKVLFKSTQNNDYKIYREDLLKFLEEKNINEDWVTYFKNKKPNIAIYPGTFCPFTTGHYSILEKAEDIFDKVIIAFGKNYEKKAEEYEIPIKIMNRQIEHYEGLLSEFVNSFGYDLTIVRGLRNASDFHYEMNFERCLKDEDEKIKFVYIFCDAKYEHVSGTVARQYEKLGKKMYRI